MNTVETIEWLCGLYPTLPDMNHENLAYRINHKGLGKSDADKLASKLIAVREGKAHADAKAPEDESIWVAVMQKLANIPVNPTKPAKANAE
jgi:hypothetical protein